MPQAEGQEQPADLPKAKGKHCMNPPSSHCRTTILQPYLANQDAIGRGNSAIWQHPPIETDQSTSFLACVWYSGAATINAVLPEELLCITECLEIIRDLRSNDDPF